MRYFLHDSNALEDEKLTELRMAFGYEGYGLFFSVLEKLASQEKPIKTAVLKKQLGVGKKLEKVWSFMEEIDLISSKNGETFNKKLLKFNEKYEKIKEKNRERQAQHREKQEVPKSVTRDKQKRNSPNSIVDNSINNNTHDANASLFEKFWTLYDKKEDRKKCLLKWEKLSPEDHQAILQHVPQYIRKHSNVNFRKNPLTYLNGECWKDPIESSSQPRTPHIHV